MNVGGIVPPTNKKLYHKAYYEQANIKFTSSNWENLKGDNIEENWKILLTNYNTVVMTFFYQQQETNK